MMPDVVAIFAAATESSLFKALGAQHEGMFRVYVAFVNNFNAVALKDSHFKGATGSPF